MNKDDPESNIPCPPHCLETERLYLSCCLIDTEGTVLNIATEHGLTAEHFYSSKHKVLYSHIERIHASIGRLDYQIVSSELIKTKHLASIGGEEYLKKLCSLATSTSGAKSLIKSILEKNSLRRLLRTTQQVLLQVDQAERPAASIIESVERDIFSIRSYQSTRSSVHIDSPLMEAMATILSQAESSNPISGVPTGIRSLDLMTTGLHPSQMVVVAARPSMGKTALALNMLLGALMPEKGPPARSLIFSLEMPSEQLALRMLAAHSGVSLNTFRDGKLDRECLKRINVAADELKECNLLIDDESGATIATIM